MPINLFDVPEFLDALTALLLRDADTLRQCGPHLSAKEMKPLSKDDALGTYRFIIAEKALSFYNSHRMPIKDGIIIDLATYARDARMSEARAQQLLDYAKKLLRTKIPEPDKITSRVLQFKHQKLYARAVRELMDMEEAGKLNLSTFSRVYDSLVVSTNGHHKSKRYFEGLEERIERRGHPNAQTKYPILYIDPFDRMVSAIGPGELGLILAPYKRGKSLMLEWISLAYTLQRLNVILISLEDPVSEVEDRLDAAVSQLRISQLAEKSRTLKHRFSRFNRFSRNRLVVYDGTHAEMTVDAIEALYTRYRNDGFIADAIVIDYDDEIVPEDSSKDRRFQFADIYRNLRKMMARHKVIGWTAAQTQRGTERLRVINGDKAAEDISKIRKVTCAIGMGQGEWGDDSIYLHVAAHKHDRQGVGCNIMTRKEAGLIYDRRKTHIAEVRDKYASGKRQHKEEEEGD